MFRDTGVFEITVIIIIIIIKKLSISVLQSHKSLKSVADKAEHAKKDCIYCTDLLAEIQEIKINICLC